MAHLLLCGSVFATVVARDGCADTSKRFYKRGRERARTPYTTPDVVLVNEIPRTTPVTHRGGVCGVNIVEIAK